MFNFCRPGASIQLICNANSAHKDRTSHFDGFTVKSDAAIPAPSVLGTIQKSVPSLCEKTFRFKPSFAVANADVQTIFSHLGQIDNPMCYDRRFIPADNGGTLALDFASTPWLKSSAPIAIIIPGLLGCSQDAYVNSAARELSRLKDGSVRGYRVVVMNPRGTPGNPLTSPHLTHAGSTDDMRTVVSYIRKNYPDSKGLFALGFSMGGGLLSNYMAEEGATCPLDAGFCISTVWDFLSCHERMEEEHFFRRICYSYSCGTRLTSVVREHEKLFRDANSKGLDQLLSQRRVCMSMFNNTFMSYLAGYPNTPAFSAGTSPLYRVGNIRRPCVLLNARDDPFYGGWYMADVERAVRDGGHENLVLAITEKGGHVGWIQKTKDGRWEQWFMHPVREFFDAISEAAKSDSDTKNS
ncbi:AB-hydrolase YheT [Fomitiporia mediterranea MF3/22]|uniref:AB-hydrolase YheT n=1 Tax=Fomitiporia mediterranea (strain MF3/22) TaxID=694068 RepID=UPI0004408BB3|nr:AB-hydrolase YheT [Fomitiporia mediterranea MF3/22]EJD07438.1 AB-hydrolase YheT [Fomitiporia mediterranea MF3/22]